MQNDLVAARADVRALADAVRVFLEWCRYGAAWKELAAIDKADEALARPGVQRIMEEQEVVFPNRPVIATAITGIIRKATTRPPLVITEEQDAKPRISA